MKTDGSGTSIGREGEGRRSSAIRKYALVETVVFALLDT
jgi:hypothetical protein